MRCRAASAVPRSQLSSSIYEIQTARCSFGSSVGGCVGPVVGTVGGGTESEAAGAGGSVVCGGCAVSVPVSVVTVPEMSVPEISVYPGVGAADSVEDGEDVSPSVREACPPEEPFGSERPVPSVRAAVLTEVSGNTPAGFPPPENPIHSAAASTAAHAALPIRAASRRCGSAFSVRSCRAIACSLLPLPLRAAHDSRAVKAAASSRSSLRTTSAS